MSAVLWLAARLGPAWRVAAFLAVVLVVLDITQHNWLQDFEVAYYHAGHAVLFDRAHLYHPVDCVHGFVNLPIVGLLFAPLSALPYRYAAAVFTVAGIIAIAASMWLLWRILAPTPRQSLPLLALFALNGPLWDSLRVGNTTHFLLPVVLLAIAMLIRRRHGVAGALFGAGGIVKIPLGLLGLYFLARRDWRALASMGGTAIGIVVASVVLLGPAVNRQWLDHCVAPTSGQVIAHNNVQSVDALLARAQGANQFSWNPIARTQTHDVLRVVLIGATLCVLVWILWRLRSDHWETIVKATGAVITCAIMIFPVSHLHYYLLLLPLSALLVTGALRVPRGPAGTLLSALALVAVSFPIMEPFAGPSRFGALADQIIVSHYYVGGLLMLALLVYDVTSRRDGVEFRST